MNLFHVPLYLLVISLFHCTFWLSAYSTVHSGSELIPKYLSVNNLFHNNFWLYSMGKGQAVGLYFSLVTSSFVSLHMIMVNVSF